MFKYPRLSRVIGTIISRCCWCYWSTRQRIVFATGKTAVTLYVSRRPITYHYYRLWPQRASKVNGSQHRKNPLFRPTGIQIGLNPCQAQPTENTRSLSAPRRCHWVRTIVFTFWSAASISESGLNVTEKTVLCVVDPTMSSNVTRVLAIGELHEGMLCNTLNRMAPFNVKTVHQTSLLRIESNLN